MGTASRERIVTPSCAALADSRRAQDHTQEDTMIPTTETPGNYRLYGKGPGMKQFKAMNWKEGYPVGNLIYATVFGEPEARRCYDEATRCNPDWQFKLVQI